MYASRADRDADIEEGADRLAQLLREDLRAASARLMVAATELPPRAWAAPVVARLQGPIPAADVPSMRLHEVWVHLVDLDVEFTFADIPADHLEHVLETALTPHLDRPDGPAVRLTAELPGGRTRTWDLVGAREDRTYEVAGPAADVIAWLTGRGDGTTLRGDVPVLPAWG